MNVPLVEFRTGSRVVWSQLMPPGPSAPEADRVAYEWPLWCRQMRCVHPSTTCRRHPALAGRGRQGPLEFFTVGLPGSFSADTDKAPRNVIPEFLRASWGAESRYGAGGGDRGVANRAVALPTPGSPRVRPDPHANQPVRGLRGPPDGGIGHALGSPGPSPMESSPARPGLASRRPPIWCSPSCTPRAGGCGSSPRNDEIRCSPPTPSSPNTS